MSDAAADLDAAQARRKKLRLRCWRRGTKEMDLILGPYANARIDEMTEEELREFEAFIAREDTELYPLLIRPQGQRDDQADRVLTSIRAFHRIDSDLAELN